LAQSLYKESRKGQSDLEKMGQTQQPGVKGDIERCKRGHIRYKGSEHLAIKGDADSEEPFSMFDLK
jgi:hypothetical protein